MRNPVEGLTRGYLSRPFGTGLEHRPVAIQREDVAFIDRNFREIQAEDLGNGSTADCNFDGRAIDRNRLGLEPSCSRSGILAIRQSALCDCEPWKLRG